MVLNQLKRSSTSFLVIIVLIMVNCIETQRVAPGVPPQTYDPNQGHHQGYQAPPPPQHQQYQQQQFQQQHPQQVQQQQVPGVPVQHQQQQYAVPQQQQHHGNAPQQQQQQVQPVQQQQQLPQAGHQQQAHGHAHAHGQARPGQLLDASKVTEERQHIQEHMSVPIDTSQMSEQELQFHYFKMHDADGNNKLDGCELVKSLIHWHDQANHDPRAGQPIPEAKIFKDDELIQMIDPILQNDDKNFDGYIDYAEFVQAQANVASKGTPQPAPAV